MDKATVAVPCEMLTVGIFARNRRYIASVGGVRGEDAKTVKAAKESLAATIARVVEREEPYVLSAWGIVAIMVDRGGGEYTSTILDRGRLQGQVQQQGHHGGFSEPTMTLAIRHLKRDMASYLLACGGEQWHVLDIVDPLDRAEFEQDLRSREKWLARYNHAIAFGCTDNEAHSYACGGLGMRKERYEEIERGS